MGQSCRADDVNICRKQTPSLPIHESVIQRSAQKAKVVGNCQHTVALTRERLKLFFAQLFLLISTVFTEQFQICVKKSKPAMIEQVDLLWQDNLTHQERVDRLSQQDGVSKFCTDAGFLTTVDVGQYFMTKDTEEFSQFTESVACREYTLPRDAKSSDPKGWIRGNTKNWTRIGSHNLLPTR